MPTQADRPYFDEFSCLKYIVERYCKGNISAPFNRTRVMNALQLLEARFTDDRAFLNEIAAALAHASIDSERYRFIADHRKGSEIVNGGRFLRHMLRDGQVALIDIERRRRRDIVDESLPFAITLDAPERADIEVFCSVVEAEQPRCIIDLACRLLIARGDIRARSLHDEPAFV
jgi:hypothetical protein